MFKKIMPRGRSSSRATSRARGRSPKRRRVRSRSKSLSPMATSYSSRSRSSVSSWPGYRDAMTQTASAIDHAIRGNPVSAGLAGYRAVRAATQTTTKRNKGFWGNGKLGGRFRRGSKLRKRYKVNGKYTVQGIENFGITMNIECRKQVDAQEALAISHTSLPGKFTAMNLWRAIIKYLMTNLKVYIKDYGHLMVGDGFVNGDVVSFNFYGPAPDANNIANVQLAISNSTTYDALAAGFSGHYDGFDHIGIRPESIEFIPSSTSRFAAVNLPVNVMKVAVCTSTELVLQNVTVDVATDNESDDVSAVPLIGKTYTTKGNNFLRKINAKTLPGLHAVTNDAALFAAYDTQAANFFVGTDMGYYSDNTGPSNNIQSTFLKPSEPPKAYEIQHCLKAGGVSLNPGQIKSSSMKNCFEMTFLALFELLYYQKTHLLAENSPFYNPKLGYCQTIYLEKAVGKANTEANRIRLWTQLNLKQSVYIFGKEKLFTAPIQYQQDY